MKRGMIVLAFWALLGTTYLSAQEKSFITIKGNELTNGVVVLHIAKADKTYDLQCNQGGSTCVALSKGKYQMVELPKNYGMYDCKNVEVYSQDAIESDSGALAKDKKLGDYCLIEK